MILKIEEDSIFSYKCRTLIGRSAIVLKAFSHNPRRHVGSRYKRNHQNSFVESTLTWLP